MIPDFFEGCSISNIKHKEFGICDDPPPPQKPAYIDIADKSKWIATVENPYKSVITFTTVDGCKKIYREDEPTKQESLCDCMLTFPNNIVFVELKDRDYPGIFSEAKNQLANTIRLFSLRHNLLVYRKRRAFIVNRKKPNFPYQLQGEMNRFKREYKVILTSDTVIKIR